jgi:predicted aconitase with swiveling domain
MTRPRCSEEVRDRPRGVLLEMIRRKTAPIAIITQELDPVLTF